MNIRIPTQCKAALLTVPLIFSGCSSTYKLEDVEAQGGDLTVVAPPSSGDEKIKDAVASTISLVALGAFIYGLSTIEVPENNSQF